MARITVVEVKEIMDESVELNTLDPFVKAASILVDNKLTGQGLSEEELTEIERWLAAHMATQSIMHRLTSKEKIGDVSVEYAGQFGKGLEATSYGQMVLVLDTSGTMKEIGKRKAWIYTVKE